MLRIGREETSSVVDITESPAGDEARSVADKPLRPDLDKAFGFLHQYCPTGPWVLSAKKGKNDPFKTRTFRPETEAAGRAWVERLNLDGHHIYFMVNAPMRDLDKKAKKEDVRDMVVLHLDIDPKAGEDPAAARAAAIAALEKADHAPPPSIMIDSGGGVQALWFLDAPLPIDGSIPGAEDAELYNQYLEEKLGGDRCHNLDRVLRLPGTINWKRDHGREPRLAELLQFHNDRRYPLAEFTAATRRRGSPQAGQAEVQLDRVPPPIDLETLPDAVSLRTRMLIVQGCDPDEQGRYGSRSEPLFAVCCELVRAGCDDDTIAAVIMDPDHGISGSVLDKRGGALRYAARQIARAREFAHDVDQCGRRVLSLAAPFRTAQRLRAEVFPHTIHINGDWLEYRNGAYALVECKTMQSKLYHILNDAVVVAEGENNQPVFKPFNPDPTKVRRVMEGLEAVCHEEADAKAPPAWLGEEGPPPLEIISLRNGLLHLPSGRLYPPTPDFFTRNALDLDYDPNAPEPVEWLRLLGSLWPEGSEPEVLQEMCGYLLLPDTSFQKIFLLVGPTRSGKGTILKVLTSLIGRPNVANPSIAELGKDFGLEPLIGKQLAAITDMRMGRNADLGEIASNLLRISGEDDVSANRKGKSYWTGRLAVRFLILANGLPRFDENSPALARRFVPLILTESFEGREDRGLIDRLLPELPGILNWAIEGWKRLQDRGRFELPSASRAAVDAIQEQSSPIAAFLAEMCETGSEDKHEVAKDVLYSAWVRWCEQCGERPGRKAKLTQLLDTAAGIKPSKPVLRDRYGRAVLDAAGKEQRVPSYKGVMLLNANANTSGERGDAQGELEGYGGRDYQG